jgi:hypothetical protein
MEADWSVEIGADLPRIVVPWADEGLCFVDLAGSADPAQLIAQTTAQLAEQWSHAALAKALLALNAPNSTVFTSKCDAWPLQADEIDPLEFDANSPASTGSACYIDIIFRDSAAFGSFEWHETWLRRTTQHLRTLPLRSARIELVLRQAEVEAAEGFAITLYAMGCGADSNAANTAWSAAVGLARQASLQCCAPLE